MNSQKHRLGQGEEMDLKPGTRWASQVCGTEVVVVRPASHPASLECGGHPMTPVGGERATDLALDPAFSEGSLIGKRFTDAESGLELLVTKAGEGSLALDGVALPLKEAQALPSSD
jgi:hypothetical protein